MGWELPPRARRIRKHSCRPPCLHGTTSACAENTGALGGIEQEKWNYLRVRGEYRRTAWEAASTAELPPRARRIRFGRCGVNNIHGTTSACAENTPGSVGREARPGNYLRVRGEYTYTGNIYGGQKELPPRARRILAKDTASRPNAGTTSACAENTGKTPCPCRRVRNYLRVRGEYILQKIVLLFCEELPPRARRILLDSGNLLIQPGTTSACAENTGLPPGGRMVIPELPPRARRIPAIDTREVMPVGTTSACAENTRVWPWPGRCPGNYLRVRGEYWAASDNVLPLLELPPRARRIPIYRRRNTPSGGTTSACAENTRCEEYCAQSWWNYLRVRGEYPPPWPPPPTFVELPPRARRIRAF